MATIETIWMDRIFLYSANVNAIILLIVLSYQLHKAANKSRRKSTAGIADNTIQTRILNSFALAVPIFTVLYTTQRSISRHAIGDCKIHVIWAGFLWTTIKLCMYLFFIARLDVAFRSSSFKFSNRVFLFLYILVIFAWITSNIQYIIWGDSVKVTSETFGITYCASLSPLFTLMYFAFCDFIISIVLTSLFVKRLFDAFYIKRQQNNSSDLSVIRRQHKVIKTVARYVTLSIVGVTTTIISLLILGLTGYFTAIALDLIVNNYCIFLMFGANVKIFHCICGPLHSLIGKCFKCCIGGDDDYGEDVIKVYDITHSQNRFDSSYATSSVEKSSGHPTMSRPASPSSNDHETQSLGLEIQNNQQEMS